MSAAPASAAKCPICGKPAQPDFRPFCSKRCSNLDLQRWLTGRYVVPAVEDDAAPGDEESDD